MKYFIYTTGDLQKGLGHLFRIDTFISKKPENVEITLVIDCPKDFYYIFDKIYDPTIELNFCNDIELIKSIINKKKYNAIIIDSLSIDEGIFDLLKQKDIPIVSLSPIFNKMHEIDILFTRNKNAFNNGKGVCFCGLEYAIINENCKKISDMNYDNNLNASPIQIGISMGGTDINNKTLLVLETLTELGVKALFWVFLGEGYKHSYTNLINSIKRNKNNEIILAKTNKSMWTVLSNCSIGVFAGGLTTLEAIYAGLPSINLYNNTQQIISTGDEIFKLGAANVCNLEKDNLGDYLSGILFKNDLKNFLFHQRERTKNLIDKNAPLRIYRMLESIIIKN